MMAKIAQITAQSMPVVPVMDQGKKLLRFSGEIGSERLRRRSSHLSILTPHCPITQSQVDFITDKPLMCAFSGEVSGTRPSPLGLNVRVFTGTKKPGTSIKSSEVLTGGVEAHQGLECGVLPKIEATRTKRTATVLRS